MNLVCPISDKTIDSNTSRMTVFLNVILMGAFLITFEPLYLIVVVIDYGIRAFGNLVYSPMRAVAVRIIRLLKMDEKPIGVAPKIFASRLGFLCAFVASVLILTGYSSASIIVTIFLMTLSIMDSVFNFCVGCWIYSYIVLPFYKIR